MGSEGIDIAKDLRDQFLNFYNDFLGLLPRIIVGVIVVVLVGFILKLIRTRINKALLNKADDPLLISFINSVFRIINVLIVSLLLLYILGFGGIAGSILGAAGISAFVIGFALKDIGENFLAGVIMAFDRPFRLGDTIKTGDVEGVITQMSLRDTHLKTFDGKDVFVPNGQLITNPLYNYTIDGYMRKQFIIGVDYGSPVDKCLEIIKSTLSGIEGVLDYDGRRPIAFVSNLNASTIDIMCQYWMNTDNSKINGNTLFSQAQSKCLDALTSEGIAMPSSIIEIKQYDDGSGTSKANLS